MGINRTVNMIKNIRNWRGYLMHKYMGKKKEPFVFITRKNQRITVPRAIMPEFKEIFFAEVYRKFLPEHHLSKENNYIVDIGANVGFYSLYALYCYTLPHIVAFEPVQRNFALLQKNVSAVPGNSITIVNKAVSSRNGTLVLKFNRSQDITTSASIFDNQYGSDEETVECIALENIFSEYRLPKIDFMKLDCEGAEYDIFYNTPASVFEKINSMAMETHNGKASNENNSSLAAYIRSLGYTVRVKPDAYIWACREKSRWI